MDHTYKVVAFLGKWVREVCQPALEWTAAPVCRHQSELSPWPTSTPPGPYGHHPWERGQPPPAGNAVWPFHGPLLLPPHSITHGGWMAFVPFSKLPVPFPLCPFPTSWPRTHSPITIPDRCPNCLPKPPKLSTSTRYGERPCVPTLYLPLISRHSLLSLLTCILKGWPANLTGPLGKMVICRESFHDPSLVYPGHTKSICSQIS